MPLTRDGVTTLGLHVHREVEAEDAKLEGAVSHVSSLSVTTVMDVADARGHAPLPTGIGARGSALGERSSQTRPARNTAGTRGVGTFEDRWWMRRHADVVTRPG